MQDPRPILGRIIAVAGNTPGPASGITYTIACHDANVDGVYRLDGQRPIRRWPDALDTVAWAVGSMVHGIVDANIVQWHSMEMPDFGACPDSGGNGAMLELLRSGGVPGLFNPPPSPGSGSSPANPGDSGPVGPPAGEGSVD